VKHPFPLGSLSCRGLTVIIPKKNRSVKWVFEDLQNSGNTRKNFPRRRSAPQVIFFKTTCFFSFSRFYLTSSQEYGIMMSCKEGCGGFAPLMRTNDIFFQEFFVGNFLSEFFVRIFCQNFFVRNFLKEVSDTFKNF